MQSCNNKKYENIAMKLNVFMLCTLPILLVVLWVFYSWLPNSILTSLSFTLLAIAATSISSLKCMKRHSKCIIIFSLMITGFGYSIPLYMTITETKLAKSDEELKDEKRSSQYKGLHKTVTEHRKEVASAIELLSEIEKNVEEIDRKIKVLSHDSDEMKKSVVYTQGYLAGAVFIQNELN